MNQSLNKKDQNPLMQSNQDQIVVYTTVKYNISIFCYVTCLCFVLFFIFGAANAVLGYNVQHFHTWQLLSAHFIHYDLKHLSLNMLALFFLLYLFPTTSKQLIRGFLVAIFFIGLYLLNSDVLFHVGFSGLLYVIPGLSLARYLFDKKYWHAFIIVCLYIIYSSSIQFTSITSEQITWTPLLWSHFLGIVAGFIIQTLTILNYKIKVSVIV